MASRQNLIVAGGVLAEAKGGAADGADLGQGLLDGVEGGVVQGTHRLERDDARLASRLEYLDGLSSVGAEGLLDKDVLATRDAGERLVVMERVGAADVDRVDPIACGELIERGEGGRPPMLGCEGRGSLAIAREGADKDGALHVRQGVEHGRGDAARSDGRDANHIAASQSVPDLSGTSFSSSCVPAGQSDSPSMNPVSHARPSPSAAAVASWSQRSLNSCPAWPFTQ